MTNNINFLTFKRNASSAIKVNKKGKITVKHYLNTRAKPVIQNNEYYYPLYVQIIVAGHKAQMKSKIPDYLYTYKGEIQSTISDSKRSKIISKAFFSDSLLEEILAKDLFPLNNLLNDELRTIQYCIETLNPFSSETFSLVNFSGQYEYFLKDIIFVLDNAIKESYLTELKVLFNKSSTKEDQRKLFKLSNYFLHFLNWDNDFSDYYQNTYEVLPSEIKFIEKNLSSQLKLQIKSFLALYSKEKYLRRYLGKKEKGLFPDINSLDWQEKGREFIMKEFQKIFGKQKAKEYIDTIDEILAMRLRNSEQRSGR